MLPSTRSRLFLVTIVAAVLTTVSPASAHTEISGSTPNDGATLNQPPRNVTVTFTQPPLSSGMAMVANGPQGQLPLAPEATGTAVVAPWPRNSGPGAYTVTYRVVASDGHPITGQLSFRIAAARASVPPASPSVTASAQPVAAAETGSGSSELLWILLGVTILLLAVVVVIVRRRGRAS